MWKVLLTSAGSGVGEAIYKSLRLCKIPISIVAADINAFNSGSFRCEKAYRIPPPDAKDYADHILSICNKEQVDVVISGSDTELPMLAAIKEQNAMNTLILTGNTGSVQICRDKQKSYEFFREKGFPFVATVYWDDVDRLISDCGFPLLAKPKGGSGSVGVEIIMSGEDLDRLVNKGDYIFQEYLISENWGVTKETIKRDDIIHGNTLIQKDEISIQVLLGQDKEIYGRFMSRNVLKFGMPTKIFPFQSNEYEDLACQMALALAEAGMVGPVNLQCKITEQGPVFFEVNPRFTGITSVRATLGFKEVEAMLQHFLARGSREEISQYLQTDYDSACCRYLDEYKFSKVQLNQLESTGYIQN